ALSGLVELRLSATRVGEAGMERLAGLKGLREVWLTDTLVPEEAARKLRAALPSCKVHTDRSVVERVFQLKVVVGIGQPPPYRTPAKVATVWLRSDGATGYGTVLKSPAELPAGPLSISVVQVHSTSVNLEEAMRLVGGLSRLRHFAVLLVAGHAPALHLKALR